MLIGSNKSDTRTFDNTGVLRPLLNIIRKHKPLTKEEELVKFALYKKGDRKAGEEILLSNMSGVYSLAKQFARDENELPDYFAEGNIGMMTALDRFDPSKGVRFYTFGIYYARQLMNRYLNETRDMIQQSKKVEVNNKAMAERNKFLVREGRFPADEELKEILEEQHYVMVKHMPDLYELDIISDSSVINDENETLVTDTTKYHDYTAERNTCEQEIDEEYYGACVAPLLKYLTPKEREIIMKIYAMGEYRDYTPGMICEEYNISEQSLNAIEKRLIDRMRVIAEKHNIGKLRND